MEQRAKFNRWLKQRYQRAQNVKQSLVEKRESNAEFQRYKTLTKEEIARRAIDRMTQNVMTYTRATQGDSAVSEEKARDKVVSMQNKLDRDKD